jgi:hypothetical protein
MRARQDRLLIALCIISIAAGFLFAMLLANDTAAAAPVTQPAVAACYAVDSSGNVETTYLSGGVSYIYPGPSDTEIEPLDDGAFVVHHSTRFVPVGVRVYLPSVQYD